MRYNVSYVLSGHNHRTNYLNVEEQELGKLKNVILLHAYINENILVATRESKNVTYRSKTAVMRYLLDGDSY